MNILFDINHPAHVHFFRHAIGELAQVGNSIYITASSKECTADLLRSFALEFDLLEGTHTGSVISMVRTLLRRDRLLHRVVKRLDPDVLVAIGGTFISHIGRISKTPSIVFYDTSEARLQNFITYPFLSHLVVPECYDGWTPRGRTFRYSGCHELAYLAPKYFDPAYDRALACGLDPVRPTVILRLVSWTANHDIGLSGLSRRSVERLVGELEDHANVIISSEAPLPKNLYKHRYSGPPADIHHLMAYSDALITESATMASESAVLGVPALLLGPSRRCYTAWLESKYGLIRAIPDPDHQKVMSAVLEGLEQGNGKYRARRDQLLEDCTDVTELICDRILAFGNR